MEEKQIEFSGFLFQKAVFNRWNKRFVKLTKNGKLLIFKDKNDTKTKHEMDVTNYEVKTVPVSKFKKQNVFFLGMNISKGKKKKIYFSCSSEKEKNDWLEMINNVLHKRQDNYRPSLSLKSLQSLSPSSIKLHYSKQQNNQNNQSTTVSPTSTSKTALDYTDDESEFGQEVPNFIEDEMDWNETLRLLLQQLPPQRTYEKFYEIHENVQHEISILQLLGNFLHTAAYCAQILIDEYPLKKSQKIIKPIFNENCDPKQKNFLMEKEHFEEDQIPGIQYETSNMIFRFYHRYPGKLESTELSMKMANHLVQNGKFIQEANIIGVYVPLQCIVDYKGFRIHVSAQLPNNKRRVKLGEVVSPKIKKKLKDLLQKYCLNLDMENVDLLEVLEISENEVYLLNVEQLFPTEKFNYEDPIINLLKKT
ncbi:sesquipedalian [Anaeramoeba ignava]|uniref:Sesquipedalian n=1 Tax=Anaeramoeba ignava TaxID=1746090 RepID=A0A9Q0LK77_ANAIG|nr:sesquipedalian [Anaeramoeba ignava]